MPYVVCLFIETPLCLLGVGPFSVSLLEAHIFNGLLVSLVPQLSEDNADIIGVGCVVWLIVQLVWVACFVGPPIE